MPAACAEFTADELAHVLAEHRGRADDLLALALALQTRLPGTAAALRDGIVRLDKAQIIAAATANLNPEEAQQAEAMVLGRAGRLTPGGLRSAMAHAVIDVNPDKARKRREEAARDARVQQWAEDSGDAALMGRELPPAEVLAADQRITAWARELEKGRPGRRYGRAAGRSLPRFAPWQRLPARPGHRVRPGRRRTRRPGRRRRRRRSRRQRPGARRAGQPGRRTPRERGARPASPGGSP